MLLEHQFNLLHGLDKDSLRLILAKRADESFVLSKSQCFQAEAELT